MQQNRLQIWYDTYWGHDKETLSLLLAHCQGSQGDSPHNEAVEQTVVLQAIWDANIMLMQRHCKEAQMKQQQKKQSTTKP